MAIGTVTTTHGLVRGVGLTGRHHEVTLFKGVPYAAPPVGPLRWAPPADPEPWDEVRSCDSYAPAAVQVHLQDRHADEYYYGGTPPVSEDCLYLNVATAAAGPGEGRPVYLWFHGGGLTNCYSYEVQFDPAELARKGVVVVSVGQRLNLFGHLALPQLRAEQGGSGNYGLLDELKALDWVVANIEAFGGDPGRITTGGQSGGTTKALALAVSPAARGRVGGVISQSGLKWRYRFLEQHEAERLGQDYLRHVGLDPDLSLEELRALDTFEVFRDAPRSVVPGDLVRDDTLLPFSGMAEGLARLSHPVGFLSGNDLGESDPGAASVAAEAVGDPGAVAAPVHDAASFDAHFRALLGDALYDKHGFADLVRVDDDDARVTALRLASLGLTGSGSNNFSRSTMLNRVFGMTMAREHPGTRAFTYLWSHLLPTSEEVRGTDRDPERVLAWHSSEMWFTFASLRPGTPPFRPWRDVDHHLADVLSSYWANFVATGDPNGPGLPVWPASGDDHGWVEITDEVEEHTGADGPLDRLLADFVEAEYGVRTR